jgi:hypothetical protein
LPGGAADDGKSLLSKSVVQYERKAHTSLAQCMGLSSMNAWMIFRAPSPEAARRSRNVIGNRDD